LRSRDSGWGIAPRIAEQASTPPRQAAAWAGPRPVSAPAAALTAAAVSTATAPAALTASFRPVRSSWCLTSTITSTDSPATPVTQLVTTCTVSPDSSP
jgi:hypothetical protein